MTRFSAWVGVIMLTALCFTTVACSRSSKMDVEYGNERLQDAIKNVSEGQSRPLRDLTDWPWDEVHVFHEHASKQDIEQVVGVPVISEEFLSWANLWVFKNEGTPIKAVTVGGRPIYGDKKERFRDTWPVDVVIENRNGSKVLAVPGRTGT